jgi:hypothetical protein
LETPDVEVIDLDEPPRPESVVSNKAPDEALNVSPSDSPNKPLIPKLVDENGVKASLRPSRSMTHMLGPGSKQSNLSKRRRAITNEHKMQIVDAIATKRDFPVDTFAYKVKEVRDEIHKNEREKLRQIHSKEAIDAEIEAIRKTPTMRIPFTTGLFMPDSVTKQLNQNKQKVSEECLINNIIKPYKWYEIDHVIIDPEDHKTIVNSNWKELWALRIGFVVLIGAVISCIVYFAIFYSKKSESADYEREKSNIVNGIKFGITACMSLIMFLCNKTTNARDSIVTNHLKTAVDVVRRVEKERWCANHTPIALPMMPVADAVPTNVIRLSSTA